jgi:agmatinase
MEKIFSFCEDYTFCGLENKNYKKAKVVFLPIPFEATVYWKGGTKEGPKKIIEASRHLELYDEEIKKEIVEFGFFTFPEFEIKKESPRKAIFQIEKIVEKTIRDKKFPVILGGEHLITLGSVLAFKKFYQKRNFSILVFDAHCDMRENFEGTKFHHATVMRRLAKDLKLKITQVGVRSLSKEEAEFIKKAKNVDVFFGKNFNAENLIKTLRENVYLSLDVDVFDPSQVPSVGTPEPGGLNWEEILEILKNVIKKRKIVGMDVVELSPIPFLEFPNFLVAKLIYKILGYILTA